MERMRCYKQLPVVGRAAAVLCHAWFTLMVLDLVVLMLFQSPSGKALSFRLLAGCPSWQPACNMLLVLAPLTADFTFWAIFRPFGSIIGSLALHTRQLL
jgi:hypothetical protein